MFIFARIFAAMLGVAALCLAVLSMRNVGLDPLAVIIQAVLIVIAFFAFWFAWQGGVPAERAYDEDQMIGIMVDENSKQMGNNSAAILDSVSAAIRRIAYITLALDWPQQLLRSIYSNERALIEARKSLDQGRGIGEPVISRYLAPRSAQVDDWDEKLKSRLSAGKIQTALATIKSSDLHSRLIDGVKGQSSSRQEHPKARSWE